MFFQKRKRKRIYGCANKEEKHSLQIFLSTFFLSGLGVTVLIVYVMNPPVVDAIQGAYVTAVIITGILTGGLAVVFPEVTEALGCLLGGFCVSMWCTSSHISPIVPK